MLWKDAVDYSLAGLAWRHEVFSRLLCVNDTGECYLRTGPRTRVYGVEGSKSDEWRKPYGNEADPWLAADDWTPVCPINYRRSSLPKPLDIDSPDTAWSRYKWSESSLDNERKFGRIGLILPYIDKQVRTPKGSGILLNAYRHMNKRYHIGLVQPTGGSGVIEIPLHEVLPAYPTHLQ